MPLSEGREIIENKVKPVQHLWISQIWYNLIQRDEPPNKW
jgi:hypothetical protein